jgi:regulator of RNase E activity RraA
VTVSIASTEILKVPEDVIEGFRGAPTSVISDNLGRLPGCVGLRPFHKGRYMIGTAVTVKTRPGDNLAILRALEMVGAGDVVVVDGGGDESRALIGEIMKTIAESRGVEGFVIDGAIRDVAAFALSDFPCYARSVIHRGPYKSGPGEINVPVSAGGDEDGVVSFPLSIATDLLKAVKAQMVREHEMIKSIRKGTYQGAYGKP